MHWRLIKPLRIITQLRSLIAADQPASRPVEVLPHGLSVREVPKGNLEYLEIPVA